MCRDFSCTSTKVFSLNGYSYSSIKNTMQGIRPSCLNCAEKWFSMTQQKTASSKATKKIGRICLVTKACFIVRQIVGYPSATFSQIFANFYMNEFDHFIKHKSAIAYYGRYVDDFVIIHSDKDRLKTLLPTISDFLQSHLHLTLHPKKIYLQHYSKGIRFLRVFIKPHRIYIGNRTKGNFYAAIQKQMI